MNIGYKTILVLLLFFVFSSSCKPDKTGSNQEGSTKTSLQIKYANGFEIVQFKGYKKLIIKAPYPNSKEVFEYLLYSSSLSKKPTAVLPTIPVPVEKIVVTSTTHIPMLEALGVENTLIGFPHKEYISSPKTRKLIANGNIKEVGIKASLNTEVLLDIQPTIVVDFSMSKPNKSLRIIEKSGIPVLLNGDWLEETPLGRAEWIKFFGLLYGKEKEADSIFNKIEASYLKALVLAKKATKQPSVLSGAMMSKDLWNLPAGESFVARFLKDANTNYLWKNSKGKGSLSVSFESVLYKGQTADYWIAPGYFSTKKQLLESNVHYQKFTAFKKDHIFTFASTTGNNGGVLYFELGPTRPDLVLKDIIKITHPTLLKDYQFTFFEKMN